MNKYEKLLQQWCDKMITLQIKGFGAPHDGGLLCPACTTLHGRVDNAVLPFIYMYNLTGNEKYYTTALGLFNFQQRMINPDGSAYNDGNNLWKGTTVFSCINFIKTLNHFVEVLKPDFKEKIIDRVKQQADWVYNYLDTTYWSNINYYAAAVSCMALAGKLLGEEKYLVRSREMMDYCLAHFTENGLFMGEGHPHNGYTETGCRLVDIGYDIEESIPCLTDAAEALGDEEILKKLAKHMADTIDLFMPDGGMDNSFGTRNNKWTYFGSRTSDGCVAALILLSKYEPILLEAAIRNIKLQESMTEDGLLYGGPHYKKTGQKPCVHHTFCHAAGLADALLVGLSEDMLRTKLPTENCGFSFKYYPEVDTYKITAGKWLATVTGCDNAPSAVGSGGSHSSGGTISLLYHLDKKQAIVGSTYSYRLAEPLNFQAPNEFTYAHRCMIPRAELSLDKKIYTNILDNHSEIKVSVDGESVKVNVKAKLCGGNCQAPENAVELTSEYIFSNDGVTLNFHVSSTENVKYILPIVGEFAVQTNNEYATADIFWLSGGFSATEYTLLPDSEGNISVRLA